MQLSQNTEQSVSGSRPLGSDPEAGGEISTPITMAPPKRHMGCGCFLWLVVLLVVCGIAGTCTWLGVAPDTRSRWASRASDMLKGTSLDSLRGYLEPYIEQKPPVPPIGESPSPAGDTVQNADGSLSGTAIQAGIGQTTPPGETGAGQTAAGENGESPSASGPTWFDPQAPIPPVKADDHVQPSFIDDLAAWVVSRYHPGARGGSLAVSVQALNQRYGVKMIGLAAPDSRSPRKALLRYTFTPSMVEGLYGLYADSFLHAIAVQAARPASGRPLSDSELKNLYRLLGAQSELLASGLESVSAVPDISQRIRALDGLAEASNEVNAKMMEQRFELDQLREKKASAEAVRSAEATLNETADQLRAALARETQAQHALAEDIRSKGARSLNDETLLYLARWVDRRLEDSSSAVRSIHSSSKVMRDLAARCQRIYEGTPEPAQQTPSSGQTAAPRESQGQGKPVMVPQAPASPQVAAPPQVPAVPAPVPSEPGN